MNPCTKNVREEKIGKRMTGERWINDRKRYFIITMEAITKNNLHIKRKKKQEKQNFLTFKTEKYQTGPKANYDFRYYTMSQCYCIEKSFEKMK